MSARKESVLDLGRFIDKVVRVKLAGGREGAHYTVLRVLASALYVAITEVSFLVSASSAAACLHPVLATSSVSLCLAVQGTLKGYDQLLNLVLDECIEFMQGASLRQHCVRPSCCQTSTRHMLQPRGLGHYDGGAL